jgi:hypothetical protein
MSPRMVLFCVPHFVLQLCQQPYRCELLGMTVTVCAGGQPEDDSGDVELLRGEEHHC